MGRVCQWETQIGGAHVLLVTPVEYYVTARVTHLAVEVIHFRTLVHGGHHHPPCVYA